VCRRVNGELNRKERKTLQSCGAIICSWMAHGLFARAIGRAFQGDLAVVQHLVSHAYARLFGSLYIITADRLQASCERFPRHREMIASSYSSQSIHSSIVVADI
jgi:hypothetical protein